MSYPLSSPMSSYQKAAGRYGGDAAATASPARLVVMLYDRLVLDLARAEHALAGADRESAHFALVHGQDIVSELLSSLDLDAWDGARGLASLYTWLLAEMMRANVTGDAGRARACRELVEPLRDAWTQASTETVSALPASLAEASA